jgi:hypothetical protein
MAKATTRRQSTTKAKTSAPVAKKRNAQHHIVHATPNSTEPGGKLGVMIGLLRRPDGASLEALMKATGWQAHSVRGAIAGAIKKRRGLKVEAKLGPRGQRVYRII